MFYGALLGCEEGRATEHWIDWNFFGHQLVTHLGPTFAASTNAVDGEAVPAFHFGLVLDWEDWENLAARLTAARTRFIIEPGVRFQGEAGEQATFFISDAAGNALEFKAFRNEEHLFATD